ncbi:MAG: hypothetical protein ACR2L1_01275, partial [Pyrinomonadaceae bacterium]
CVIFIILAQIVAVKSAFACSTDEQSLAKAQQTWEQAIASLGGRERILNIKNIMYYNKEKTTVSLEVLPDKLWYWSENRKPIGTDVKTYDFSKNLGYRIKKGDPDNFSYPLTGDSKERRLSGLLYTLLETKWIKPKLIGSDIIKIDGKEYDVVCTEVTFPDNQTTDKQITERHDYLFDRITHLVFRNIRYFDKSIGGGDYTLEYSNYIDVKGIKFAREIRDKFSHDKHWSSKSAYITDIDVDYKEDLFDKPPSIKDGPDGWKKIR